MFKTVFNPQDDRGMHWFISNKPFKAGKKQYGYGVIEYGEGSIYEGNLYYDGISFGKMGYGEQDFTHSVVEAVHFGAPSSIRLYKFIGMFDCKKCDWMYGNGIAYFTDNAGNPKAFIKGYFNRTKKAGEWKGEFSQKDLLKGYTLDMEIDQNPLMEFPDFANFYAEEFKNVKECDLLVFGDSWTQIWRDTERDQGGSFYEDVKKYAPQGANVINVGIGGTKYCDWFDFIYKIVIPRHPKKIFINLGFNDLHAGLGIKKTMKDFTIITNDLKKALAKAEIYIASVCHLNNYRHMWEEEEKFNAIVKPYCEEHGMHYLATDALFKRDGKVFEDIDDYSMKDRIHLNLKGYALWAKFVLEEVFKK